MGERRTWPLRQAAVRAGVTRAVARAVATDGLVPPGDLDDLDVVVLRAAAAARTLLFAGESWPANTGRELRDRERDLASAIRTLAADGAGRGACVLMFPDEVVSAGDTGGLITAVLDAHTRGRQYLALPVGEWLVELLGGKENALAS